MPNSDFARSLLQLPERHALSTGAKRGVVLGQRGFLCLLVALETLVWNPRPAWGILGIWLRWLLPSEPRTKTATSSGAYQSMHEMSDYIGQEVHLNHAWRIEHQIGSGGFGRVYAARSYDDNAGVVKFIPKAPGAERELLFENLTGVPNVIPILDWGESENCWLIVMPEAEKSLRDYINESNGRINPTQAIPILVDITEALAEIEGRVVHRDIKPENVLFHDGHWCLADCGISRYADATTAPIPGSLR